MNASNGKVPVGIALGAVVAASTGLPGMLIANFGGAAIAKGVNRLAHDITDKDQTKVARDAAVEKDKSESDSWGTVLGLLSGCTGILAPLTGTVGAFVLGKSAATLLGGALSPDP